MGKQIKPNVLMLFYTFSYPPHSCSWIPCFNCPGKWRRYIWFYKPRQCIFVSYAKSSVRKKWHEVNLKLMLSTIFFIIMPLLIWHWSLLLYILGNETPFRLALATSQKRSIKDKKVETNKGLKFHSSSCRKSARQESAETKVSEWNNKQLH